MLAVRGALGDACPRLRRTSPAAASWATCPGRCPADLGAVLDRSTWDEPRVFAEIQRLGAVAEDEMDRVFNRGVGMALVVDAGSADAALRVLEQAGQPAASVIGEVVAGEPGVRFR